MRHGSQKSAHAGAFSFAPPQAGVALGMATVAAAGLHENGEFIQMIILFGVLIYELFSPMLSKMALMRAGDIQPEERKSSRGHIG